MGRYRTNPMKSLVFKFIKEEDFQNKLNIISEFNFVHFEKWFQIELACYFKKKKFFNYCPFTWTAEYSHTNKKGKIIPDFTIFYNTSGNEFYTEIKQYDSFITCFNKMVDDFYKVKNAVDKKNSENINCIGIFKTEYFSEDKLSNLKDGFKKDKHLITKIEEIKIKEIPNTKYSLMYF